MPHKVLSVCLFIRASVLIIGLNTVFQCFVFCWKNCVLSKASNNVYENQYSDFLGQEN